MLVSSSTDARLRPRFFFLPSHSLEGLECPVELFERCYPEERDPAPRNWFCWVSLHQGQWRNGTGYHAPGHNHSPTTDRHVGKYDDSRTYEYIILEPDRSVFFSFLIVPRGQTDGVGDDSRSHSDRHMVSDGDPFRKRSLDQCRHADTTVGPDPHAAQTMQKDSQRRLTWREKRKDVKGPLNQTRKNVFLREPS